MGEKLRLLPLRRLAGWGPGLQRLGQWCAGRTDGRGQCVRRTAPLWSGAAHGGGLGPAVGGGRGRAGRVSASAAPGRWAALSGGGRSGAGRAGHVPGAVLARRRGGLRHPAGGAADAGGERPGRPAPVGGGSGRRGLSAAWGWGLFRAGARARRGGPLGAESLLLCCAGLCGLQQLPAMGLLPGVVVLAAGGLALAFRGRLRDCAIFCLCGAGALAAADPDLCFAGLAVAVGCLAAAYFTPGERLGCATLFLSGGLLGVLAAPQSSLAVGFLGSAALGEAAFFALPARLLAALPGQTDPAAAQRPRVAGAVSQLESVANALTGIADTVNQVYETLPRRGESYNWVVDYVAEELCRTCGSRERCWVQDYSTTMDGFYRLKPILEQQGRAALEQLPGQFCRCIHPTELCSCSSRGYALYRGRRESRVKAGAMRAALTEQYSAMAQALSQMAGQLGQSIVPDVGKTEQLGRLFASIGLEPLECQAGFDAAGRLRAGVTVSRTPFSQQELSEITGEAQRILHRPLTLPG